MNKKAIVIELDLILKELRNTYADQAIDNTDPVYYESVAPHINQIAALRDKIMNEMEEEVKHKLVLIERTSKDQLRGVMDNIIIKHSGYTIHQHTYFRDNTIIYQAVMMATGLEAVFL